MADYKVRLVTGRYCLAETKNNWIVGCGYNPDRPEGQQWEQGRYFSKANGLMGVLGLYGAVEYISAWAEVYYDRLLDQEELDKYEMMKGEEL